MRNKIWIIAGLLIFGLALVFEIISDKVGSEGYVSHDIKSIWTNLAVVFGIISVLTSFVCIFKTHGNYRILFIITTLVSFISFSFALFAYGFSGYGL